MRFQFCTTALLLMTVSAAGAQVASHAHTGFAADPGAKLPAAQMQAAVVNDNPVVRVNQAALTNRDLIREMYAIFPYGREHKGFPPGLEPEIRKGALEMIIFEELVYQEAGRRNIVISAAKLDRAQAQFKKQFASPKHYQEYLHFECQDSAKVLRQKVRRSLLIEALIKTEVQDKSLVSLAQAKAYYDKNPKEYTHGESFSLQTISIIPPEKANAEVQQEARKRAQDALRLAKATKTFKEFGLIAEKMSDDDWHVNMGDHKAMDASKLPPPVVEAGRKMKIGDVSDLLQFGTNYAIFRLNAHTPAGKTQFEAAKKEIQTNLQKARYNEARADFGKRLRKSAKVEVL